MKINSTDGILIDAEVKIIPDSIKGIIFCHGLGVYKESEIPQVLAAKILQQNGYSTILFDFRAHGKSSGKSKYDFTIKGELQDIKAIYQYFTDHNVFNIGLCAASFGGSIAALFVGLNPNLINALYLINPLLNYDNIFHPKTPWQKQRYANFLNKINKTGYFVKKGHLSDITFNKQIASEMLYFQPWKQIQSYKNPIEIIHSKNDIYVDYREIENFFNKLESNTKKLMLTDWGEHGFCTKASALKVAKYINRFMLKFL